MLVCVCTHIYVLLLNVVLCLATIINVLTIASTLRDPTQRQLGLSSPRDLNTPRSLPAMAHRLPINDTSDPNIHTSIARPLECIRNPKYQPEELRESKREYEKENKRKLKAGTSHHSDKAAVFSQGLVPMMH